MLHLISFAFAFKLRWGSSLKLGQRGWVEPPRLLTMARSPLNTESLYLLFFRRTGEFDAVALWRTTACFPAALRPMVGRPTTTAITQHPLCPGTKTKGAATGDRSKDTYAVFHFHRFSHEMTYPDESFNPWWSLFVRYCFYPYVFYDTLCRNISTPTRYLVKAFLPLLI